MCCASRLSSIFGQCKALTRACSSAARLRASALTRAGLPLHNPWKRGRETDVLRAPCSSEQIQLAQQRTLVARSPSSYPPSTRIEGLEYREAQITGRAFEWHVLSQLSWWEFFKVIFLFLLGRRLQARRIVAQAVLVRIGLLGISTVALDHSGDEICEALLLFASPQSTPALVHCTFGKDRTGFVCALLMILGLPIAAIEYDYFLSDAALISDRAERIFELREGGFTDHFASTAENMIQSICHHMDTTYGGFDAYLDRIGFPESDRTRFRQRLLE